MKASKVIGLGLNKTGTTTLARCLAILGYQRPLSCRPDLLAAFRHGQLEPALAAIEDCGYCEDWPYPLMYREIFERFGDRARYVLTRRRDAGRWLDSLKRHALRTNPDRNCRRLAYGYDYPHGAEAHHLRFYEQHNRSVVEFFEQRGARHLLLEVTWDAGDGWQVLCGFLGEPVPDSAFPHENKGELPIPAGIEAENRRRIALQLECLSASGSG